MSFGGLVSGFIRSRGCCGMMRSWMREIAEWIGAAKVRHAMAFNRLGCMGHYYSGMLDIYTDLTQQYAAFGGHIELIEVEELAVRRRQVSGTEVAQRVQLFLDAFDVQPDCPDGRVGGGGDNVGGAGPAGK